MLPVDIILLSLFVWIVVNLFKVTYELSDIKLMIKLEVVPLYNIILIKAPETLSINCNNLIYKFKENSTSIRLII